MYIAFTVREAGERSALCLPSLDLAYFNLATCLCVVFTGTDCALPTGGRKEPSVAAKTYGVGVKLPAPQAVDAWGSDTLVVWVVGYVCSTIWR